MKIEVTRNEIVQLFSEKYNNDVELVIVNNDTDTEEHDDMQEDDTDNVLIESEFNAKELVKITKIDKILKKALTDQNFKSKIPNNPKATCEEAAEEFIKGLSANERRIIIAQVNHIGFRKFSILWQEFQNIIHKKL